MSNRRINPDDDNAVDDAIDAWHENDGGVPLHEHLGWTREEYRAWLGQGRRKTDFAKTVEHGAVFAWAPMLILAAVIVSVSHHRGLALVGYVGVVMAFVAGVVRGVSSR